MSSTTQIKDSGTRESFTTGSVRDTREGKGRYDLISPLAEKRLALHLENGAKKYGDRNWEKGQPVTRYYDSARRHLSTYMEGHRDEDHLSAALWNLQAIIHTEECVKRGLLGKELIDWPNYVGLVGGAKSHVRYFKADCWNHLRHPSKSYDWFVCPSSGTFVITLSGEVQSWSGSPPRESYECDEQGVKL